jgi:hypothetical protein
MQTNGAVALTKALDECMRKGDFKSMGEVTVGAYLQEKLAWKLGGVGVQLQT